MKGKALVISVLLMTLAGCVEPVEIQPEVQQEERQTPADNGPYTIVSPLLSSPDEEYDIVANANENNTLILWVAAGCSGCHDWTEMISQSLENGTLSNDSNIVSVHRYPAFESQERLTNTYGNESKSTYTPWPLLTPTEDEFAVNASTGSETSTTIVDAYDEPVTPTLQIIDSNGYIIWESGTYWASYEVIEEISEII